jgi:hypothetical protein
LSAERERNRRNERDPREGARLADLVAEFVSCHGKVTLQNETNSTPWAKGQPMLCITGRGPLDEAAAGMLVQLLGKHGISSRLVPYGAVSRSHIDELSTEHAKMACIFYLDISGTPRICDICFSGYAADCPAVHPFS